MSTVKSNFPTVPVRHHSLRSFIIMLQDYWQEGYEVDVNDVKTFPRHVGGQYQAVLLKRQAVEEVATSVLEDAIGGQLLDQVKDENVAFAPLEDPVLGSDEVADEVVDVAAPTSKRNTASTRRRAKS